MKYIGVVAAIACLAGCSGGETHDTDAHAIDSTLVSGVINPAVLVPTLTYEQRQGRYLYQQYCSVCHGTGGAADGFNTYNLDPKPHSLADSAYVSAFSDDALGDVIRHGGRGVNKSPLMPPYGWTVNEDEITYLVAYVRVLAKSGGN